DPRALAEYAVRADLVVGAVLIPGAKAPVLIDLPLLRRMKKGAVIVDVSIDQGGCCVASRPTTHSDPVFVVEDVVHYCVANMPGAVGRTSSQALGNATLPYVRKLARGLEGFLAASPGQAAALNLRDGRIICPEVAATFPDLA
ncbi:MAG: alanine dehydrogenase, partial [Deltaproteobacteria bacterium]|nr:alanine dehydrogenase [Deltaproteobacteria bacterium]